MAYRIGGNLSRVDTARLLKMYVQGGLKLDHMICGYIKLNDINEGFSRMKQGTLVRQLIDFSAG